MESWEDTSLILPSINQIQDIRIGSSPKLSTHDKINFLFDYLPQDIRALRIGMHRARYHEEVIDSLLSRLDTYSFFNFRHMEVMSPINLKISSVVTCLVSNCSSSTSERGTYGVRRMDQCNCTPYRSGNNTFSLIWTFLLRRLLRLALANSMNGRMACM